jgi:uncharacterized membrane protein
MEPIKALMKKGISPFVFIFLSYLLFLVIFSLCLCLRVRLLQLRQQLLHICWHRVLLVDEVFGATRVHIARDDQSMLLI